MVLSFCVVSAIFLLVYFLHLQNENVGYLSFVAAFLIPSLFLPVIFRGAVVSVNSGGSPLFNLVLISSQGAFLAVAFFSIHEESEAKPTKESLNTAAKYSTLFFGFALLLMQFILAFTSSPRVIPVIQTFIFSSSIIILRRMSFEKLQISIVKVFFFISMVVLLGILLRFPWSSVDDYNFYIQEGIYFSPFKSLLGLPSRTAGPFGSAQDLGIFCAMGFALTIFKKISSSAWVSFHALVFFFLGSLSGSRTFYVTLFTAVILKALSSVTKKQSINFLPIAIAGLVTVYFVVTTLFLPAVSSSQNVALIGGRSVLWQTIFEHWSDNGLLGYGPNTLQPFMYSLLGFAAYGHAHNSILQYLWDFGIPGALAIILCIISWIVTIGSQKKSGVNKLCIFLVYLTIQSEITFDLVLRFKGLLILLFYAAIIENGKFNSPTQKEKITDD
jgi:O-antigen ligase